jgi:hypothetical protein
LARAVPHPATNSGSERGGVAAALEPSTTNEAIRPTVLNTARRIWSSGSLEHSISTECPGRLTIHTSPEWQMWQK